MHRLHGESWTMNNAAEAFRPFDSAAIFYQALFQHSALRHLGPLDHTKLGLEVCSFVCHTSQRQLNRDLIGGVIRAQERCPS